MDASTSSQDSSAGRSSVRKWIRRFTVALGTVGALLILALLVMRMVAARWGVQEVVLPAGSEIEARAGGADYTDAYSYPLEREYTIEQIESLAFQKGREVARTVSERVYEGGAPGLRFLVSYHLKGAPPSQVVTLSTVVFYESWVGSLYFTPVKLVHRQGVPFMTAQMIRGSEARP